MHAGEASNGSDQRAHGDKFLPATVKTIAPAEKQNKKCTPAAASGVKGGKFTAGRFETTTPAEKRD